MCLILDKCSDIQMKLKCLHFNSTIKIFRKSFLDYKKQKQFTFTFFEFTKYKFKNRKIPG